MAVLSRLLPGNRPTHDLSGTHQPKLHQLVVQTNVYNVMQSLACDISVVGRALLCKDHIYTYPDRETLRCEPVKKWTCQFVNIIRVHVCICDRACKNRPCAAKVRNRVFYTAGYDDIFLNFIGQSTQKL